jgi:hypothetical protein
MSLKNELSNAKKNHWISNKDYFAVWTMEFMPVANSNQVDRLLEFTEKLLHIAEQENIFHIIETRLPAIGAPVASYIEQLQWQIHTLNKFSFFGYLNGTTIKDKTYKGRTIGTICYYDKSGQIVSSEVENMGELMKQLHSDEVLFTYPTPPVVISGLEDISCDNNNIPHKMSASIRIRTNIWFPKVIAYLGKSYQTTYSREVVDNSELAALHTPRLNRFLEQARALTLTYDGDWRGLAGEHGQPYYNLVYETGIHLDTA